MSVGHEPAVRLRIHLQREPVTVEDMVDKLYEYGCLEGGDIPPDLRQCLTEMAADLNKDRL